MNSINVFVKNVQSYFLPIDRFVREDKLFEKIKNRIMEQLFSPGRNMKRCFFTQKHLQRNHLHSESGPLCQDRANKFGRIKWEKHHHIDSLIIW